VSPASTPGTAACRSTLDSHPESLPSLSSASGHGASLIEDDDEYDEEYDITTSAEGEVDGFIKFRPTIDELLHGEEAARSRSRSLVSSSVEETFFGGGRNESNSQPTPFSNSDHPTLLTGRFYKQGPFPLLPSSGHSRGQVSFASSGNCATLKFGHLPPSFPRCWTLIHSPQDIRDSGLQRASGLHVYDPPSSLSSLARSDSPDPHSITFVSLSLSLPLSLSVYRGKLNLKSCVVNHVDVCPPSPSSLLLIASGLCSLLCRLWFFFELFPQS
jgi:hypothetical protein